MEKMLGFRMYQLKFFALTLLVNVMPHALLAEKYIATCHIEFTDQKVPVEFFIDLDENFLEDFRRVKCPLLETTDRTYSFKCSSLDLEGMSTNSIQVPQRIYKLDRYTLKLLAYDEGSDEISYYPDCALKKASPKL